MGCRISWPLGPVKVSVQMSHLFKTRASEGAWDCPSRNVEQSLDSCHSVHSARAVQRPTSSSGCPRPSWKRCQRSLEAWRISSEERVGMSQSMCMCRFLFVYTMHCYSPTAESYGVFAQQGPGWRRVPRKVVGDARRGGRFRGEFPADERV